MATPDILNSSPPQPNVPFLTPTGDISRPWFYFLISLFARTGGNTPITPAALQHQISALFVEEAFDDLSTPETARSLPALTGLALADDVPRTPPVSLPVLMAEALADGGQKPTLDPLIASLLVSDPQENRAPVYVSSQVLIASAVSLTTLTAADVTSITLTTGVWLVWGTVAYDSGAGTGITITVGWTSTTSATAPTNPNNGAYASWLAPSGAPNIGGVGNLTVGPQRMTINGTVTVYLSTLTAFSTSTLKAYGFIGAIPA